MKTQITYSPIINLTIFATLALTLTLALTNFLSYNHKLLLLSLSWCTLTSLAAYFTARPCPVLLLDYSCHLPDSDHRSTFEICEYFSLRSRRFLAASEDFMRAIFRKSGLGDETYGPPYIFQADYDARLPCALQETQEGMFGAVGSLLAKASVDASKVTHVIVGCSMYSPSPSLAALVVSRFALNEGVKTYNLSGMGCSAGTVAVDLASRLLQREIGYVLIVLTESLSLNW